MEEAHKNSRSCDFEREMKLKLDYEFMTEDAVAGGVTERDFVTDSQWINTAFDKVMQGRGKGMQQWCELPIARQTLDKETVDFCDGIRRKAENLIILGIGGSALGTLAVIHALKHYHNNERKKPGRPAIYVEDNIGPVRIKELFDVIDPLTSYFVVVTKSGETTETLSQFLIVYEMLKRELGHDAKDHIIAITTLYKGAFYNIAAREGFRIFGLCEGVGGRFSVFDNAGLIPICIAGIDVDKLLLGARNMSFNAFLPDIKKNLPLMTAYLKLREFKRGKNISVFMPYSDKLRYITDFYCQLWAESLGKALDNDGNIVNTGQTPVKALGATDQHSQLQLYTEGPFDKVITFLAIEDFGGDITIPGLTGVEYLAGHTLGELLTAQRLATAFSLKKSNRPNYTLIMPGIEEETVGELLAMMMYETAFAGAMLNVNTFDQPGVEGGKKATFALLEREGFEELKSEIEGAFSGKYTIN